MNNNRINHEKANQPIAAISTPLGIGGIGIVRMSGIGSIEIASELFRTKKHRKMSPEEFVSHFFYYGYIIHPVELVPVDEVMLVVMRQPKSYTKEDIVEIHCHGGLFIVNKILKQLLSLGARIADPGEFTKIAFLNGRIDLSQAESVIDIIGANNENSLKSSLYQLSGGLKDKIQELRKSIIQLTTQIEMIIDFPEQEIPEIKRNVVKKRIKKILYEIDQLIKTVQYGRIIKEGIRTMILGKANVGKSSLFNLLLNQNRSIVTSLAGTTRDIIEEQVNIGGFIFHLVDTAGTKTPENLIEKISLKKVEEYMEFAQILILVLDYSRPLEREDEELLEKVQFFMNQNPHLSLVIVENKVDLPKKIDNLALEKVFNLNQKNIIKISAKKHKGIQSLEDILVETITQKTDIPNDGLVINNQRHQELLCKVKNRLNDLLVTMENGLPEDFIVLDLRYTADQLAKITGDAFDEEILKNIFSKFCIGK